MPLAARSPTRSIASSGVPFQIWWSRQDRTVIDQASQSGGLFTALRGLNPAGADLPVRGHWTHSDEMRSTQLLPIALAEFGLLPTRTVPDDVTYAPVQP